MNKAQLVAKLQRFAQDPESAVKETSALILDMASRGFADEAESRQAEFAACGIALVAVTGQKALNALERSNGITNVLVALYLLGFGDGMAHQASTDLRRLVEETK